MQKTLGSILRSSLAMVLLGTCFLSLNAHASGHGGGGGEGGGGAGAYEKLEPFTVNLVGLKQMIQLSMTLKLAKPETGEKIKLYMPAVRHEMILLLSSKTAAQVETSEGKQRLILETKATINRALGLDEKEGVADVLFEQIIIQ